MVLGFGGALLILSPGQGLRALAALASSPSSPLPDARLLR
jgi:hypothetical protein